MGSPNGLAIASLCLYLACPFQALSSAQTMSPSDGDDLRCMQRVQHADALHRREIEEMHGLHERKLGAQEARHLLEISAIRASYEMELATRAERFPAAAVFVLLRVGSVACRIMQLVSCTLHVGRDAELLRLRAEIAQLRSRHVGSNEPRRVVAARRRASGPVSGDAACEKTAGTCHF
jgi:hypothetical protein